MKLKNIVVAGVAGLAVASPAYAANILPDATVTITNSTTTLQSGLSSDTVNCSQNGWSCSASYTASYGNGDLGITANSTAQWPEIEATYDVIGKMYFEVNGPINGTVVPILITANATTAAGRDSIADAEISITSSSFTESAGSCVATSVSQSYWCGGQPSQASFSGEYQANVFANDQLSFVEDLHIADYDFASGSIDPMITIDPTWAANNPGYSLEFSPNTIGGVPEPATWAMFLIGFGGIGFAMRRPLRKIVVPLA